MNNAFLFPEYIPRAEEQLILAESARVRREGTSRVVLLYGSGGSGKTRLLRQLEQGGADDTAMAWLSPIDVDDSEYWLLSNLELHVANQLEPVAERPEPQTRHFARYRDYLSRLPTYTQPKIGHETVVSHLARIKGVFRDCYRAYVEATGQTVVILFDTVEAIRGTSLLLTMTQWMKALPATLFVLAGRPVDPGDDPIEQEFADPYQGLPVTTIHLGDFPYQAALDYVNSSTVASGLTDSEKQKLVLLTQGHPLWLAFTLAYLDEKGLPEEADVPLELIERTVPYSGVMTSDGQIRHEDFKRRLVTPYREADFWHESIKRLAVLRQTISEPIWQQLMQDQPLPEGVASLDDAWAVLLATPWIRPRANRRFVTLHDAVAEELAARIIPLHDQDEHWRRELWRRAADVYLELAVGPEAELRAEQAALDERLQPLTERAMQAGEDRPPSEEERAYLDAVAQANTRRRDLDQLKVAGLFYRLLIDRDAGCQLFLSLLEEAKGQHDVLFEDLLALEMQRFLPGGFSAWALGDVVGPEIERFRAWLLSSGRLRYLAIGLSMADYLIDNEDDEQAAAALALLDQLPVDVADYRQRYEICVLRGNACMRIPSRVKDGLEHFQQALADAKELTTPDAASFVANAYKELGFYYRNEGLWGDADKAYEQARDAISARLSGPGTESDREEMASIQTNWAYVKGLVGSYRDGANLAESAITMRRRLGLRQAEGTSWSVCGEVYRYERRYQKAWAAFIQAEHIFHELRNWSWLGLIYQQQAICLYQATQDGIVIVPGRDPISQAKQLITLALDICRDNAVRGYPSALNRAGRIFGHDDAEEGLRHLAQGIEAARTLSDGWFLFANLIEYAELSYEAWLKTGHVRYLAQIAGREAEIRHVMAEYEFDDLRGRWLLLQGHLGIHRWEESRDERELSAALDRYADGFALIAKGYVGSSGASAIPDEFRQFDNMLRKLPPEVREEWLRHLRSSWRSVERGSTLLLARLEELY